MHQTEINLQPVFNQLEAGKKYKVDKNRRKM